MPEDRRKTFVRRRDFVKKSALGAIAVTQLKSGVMPELLTRSNVDEKKIREEQQSTSSWSLEAPSNQKMNLDYISYLPGVEYFLLGNGDIQGVVQYCKDNTEAGNSSFFGFTIMDAERFTEKWSTYLYRTSSGLANGRMWIIVDGKTYAVSRENFKEIGWKQVEEVPVVSMRWEAGGCEVEEELFVPNEGGIIFRRGAVRNDDVVSHKVETGLMIYPNVGLFDEIYTDEKTKTVNAEGYATLRLVSMEKGVRTLGRYDLRVDVGELAPGREATTTYAYCIRGDEKILKKKSYESIWKDTASYWKAKTQVSTSNTNLDHVWEVSRTGVKAHVARSGKRDSGTWEYAMEWVRDDVMIMTAFLMAGFHDEAKVLLLRMLNKFVASDGRTVESSRVYDYQFTEIDQNGELLYGIWMYLCWSGDFATIRRYWDKIILLARLPLKPYFRDKKSGLLSNQREFWERSDSFGVKPGFELAYQFWVIMGLEKISEVADKLGRKSEAKEWRDAGRSIKNAFLNDPKFRLVEDGHFIKRRTLDGEWQKTFVPPNRKNMPAGTPIAIEENPLAEPDASEVLPIMFGMVDPASDLSRRTLEWIEPLWNQRWDIGGYERYDSSSEPEPAGPWPFPSLFIAQAYWEAGNYQKGMRVVDWLNNVHGGISGGWFEYYPKGHPDVGLVGWNWAEVIRLVIDHIIGVKPELDNLVLRPKLAPELKAVKTQVRVREMDLNISMSTSAAITEARINGKEASLKGGQLVIPYRKNSRLNIEINIGH